MFHHLFVMSSVISFREMCAALYAESTVNAVVKMETLICCYARSPVQEVNSCMTKTCCWILNKRPYLQNAQFLSVSLATTFVCVERKYVDWSDVKSGHWYHCQQSIRGVSWDFGYEYAAFRTLLVHDVNVEGHWWVRVGWWQGWV